MSNIQDGRIKGESSTWTGKSVIVAAHPDDEVLWFSSVLEEVDHVIFCYSDVPGNPKLTDARKIFAKEYPRDNVTYLGFYETGTLNSANWNNPVISEYGLEILQHDLSPASYETVFPKLVSRLTAELATYETIFTHNPWGEYGNEEHVQVNRAVQAAQALLGFDCWFPGCVSMKSHRLMSSYEFCDAELVTCSIKQETRDNYIELYMQYGCWTWHEDWEKFEYDYFYKNISLHEGVKSVERGLLMNWVKDDEYTRRLGSMMSTDMLEVNANCVLPKIMHGCSLVTSNDCYRASVSGSRGGITLSESAAMILNLCDGRNTASEIVKLISYMYNIEESAVRKDVLSCLIDLRKYGLLLLNIDSSKALSNTSAPVASTSSM